MGRLARQTLAIPTPITAEPPMVHGWRHRIQAYFATISPTRARAFATTALLLLAIHRIFWTFARRLTFSTMSADEACFLWAGWSYNRGLVPYRDFFEWKPPVVFICNAIALHFLGLEEQRYRYFFTYLAGIALFALTAALLSRRVHKIVILALMTVIIGLWLEASFHDSSFDDAESIGISFYFLGVASLLASTRFARVTDFLGGTFLTIAVFSKEPFAMTVIPTWLAFLSLRYTPALDKDNARRFATFSLAGVAFATLSMVVFLAARGAVGDYITAVQRISRLGNTACVKFGVWTPGTFWENWARNYDRLTAGLYNFGWLIGACPLLFAPIFLSRRRFVFTSIFAGCAVLAGTYTTTLGGCFFPHYFMLSMVGLFFFMIIGALLLSKVMGTMSRRPRVYLAMVLLLIPGWWLWPRFARERDSHYKPAAPFDSPELINFVKEHTAPNDTIMSTGLPSIYLLTERRHATADVIFYDALTDLYPGENDEQRFQLIYEQMLKHRPKVIIIEPFNDHKRQKHAEALWFRYIKEFSYQKINDHLYLRPN
jgi:hypothetical protein